jgi:hypothetical protein
MKDPSEYYALCSGSNLMAFDELLNDNKIV